MQWYPVGDAALAVSFGQTIEPAVNRQIRQLLSSLQAHPIEGITDLVPTYTTMLVAYDPLVLTYDELQAQIRERLSLVKDLATEEPARVIELPTVYGGRYGPDLGFVAEHAGLSEQEVIEIHSGRDYLVYMLGFLPGFAYLGGMDERIATPRLSTPRPLIPRGSVGIAGSQTGTYPSDSPGGWQIIGRTPVSLYDMSSEQGALLLPGDLVRYVPITPEEYEAIAAKGGEGA